MDTIRIGVIGAGGVAKSRNIPRLQAVEGVELTQVWNRTPEKSQAVADEFGIGSTVADWREIAESPDIDAVVIATPPVLHHDATLAALAGGKHVLCQARMARNLAEALAMAEAARNSDRVTVLYPPLPGLKGDNLVRRLIHNEGYVGDVHEVRMSGMSARSGVDEYHWRLDAAISGCHMLAMGLWVEVLNRWIGPATSVFARANTYSPRVPTAGDGDRDATVPDSLALSVQLTCGATGTYHFSSDAAMAPQDSIEIYGSKGAIVYTLPGDGIIGATEGMEGMEVLEPRPDEVREQTTDAEFIQAIREGSPVHPSFEEGLRYMEFCEGVAQSVHFGKPVDLPPEPLMETWSRPL